MLVDRKRLYVAVIFATIVHALIFLMLNRYMGSGLDSPKKISQHIAQLPKISLSVVFESTNDKRIRAPAEQGTVSTE
ncbi:MAG TPA: hypothetical protein VFW00_08500, partial [Rhodocyclaceae bacterium]|nr:hypothetical protein [Rhodocyclaceae bacterium]